MVERAAYRPGGTVISAADLGLRPVAALLAPGLGLKARMEAFRAQLIREALTAAKGNQAQAAQDLGLTYHRLRYYKRKLDLGGGRRGPAAG